MSSGTSVHELEELVFFTLLQLAVIIPSARMAGRAALYLGQPSVVGEIIGGLLLGPSLVGKLFPETFAFVFKSVSAAPLQIMSQIGLILLMFQIGAEIDFSHLREKNNRRAVLGITVASLLLPLLAGAGWAWGSHASLAADKNPFHYILFVAVAFSITALPILGRILIEFKLSRTRMGALVISAASINDVVGWVLLAVVSALAMGQFSGQALAGQVGGLVVLAVVAIWLLKPWLRKRLQYAGGEGGGISRDGMALLLTVLFLAAMTTYKLGIFAIFGGFLIGFLLHEERKLVEAWERSVNDFVGVFFLPIFFTFTGLRTNVQGLNSWTLWAWALGLIALATASKYLGCAGAARWAGIPVAEAKCIGIMMNTRALMELVVLNVGYDLGVIPQDVFTMLVLMAIFSTVVTSPILRRWLPAVSPAARSGKA
jgi:Kef-type K+ transport system membrane component KefB